MKKATTYLLSVILFSTLLFAACAPIETADDDSKDEIESVLSRDITSSIIEAGVFPEMVERGVEDLEQYYFGIATEGVADASYYISPAGAYSDEITVIRTEADSRHLAGIRAFFEEWVDTKADMWRSYNPEQAQKLDNSIIIEKDYYIALFICEDPAVAAEIFNNSIA
ncbi:MAG: DUF4358 domain-containing protein [Oscillospiraceae bacterium]|nr:DUF4358 domain-containing protein [Oscillospiraceae bacterium]